jgi:hypothetical protein
MTTTEKRNLKIFTVEDYFRYNQLGCYTYANRGNIIPIEFDFTALLELIKDDNSSISLISEYDKVFTDIIRRCEQDISLLLSRNAIGLFMPLSRYVNWRRKYFENDFYAYVFNCYSYKKDLYGRNVVVNSPEIYISPYEMFSKAIRVSKLYKGKLYSSLSELLNNFQNVIEDLHRGIPGRILIKHKQTFVEIENENNKEVS